MTKLTPTEYLGLSKGKKFLYKLKCFFCGIPTFFKNLIFKIGRFFKKFGIGFVNYWKTLFLTFVHGDWKTKVSYLVMGFGSVTRGQILRGILFFILEVVFVLYMVLFGGHYLGKLGTLGTLASREEWIEELQTYKTVYYDNSFKILLYGVMTIFFIIAFIYTWNLNVKQNRINEEIIKEKKKIKSTKDDLRALVDHDFYKTLLALPTLGIIIFTILPIFFMILVAFTNFDVDHQPPQNLFAWVGLDNFNTLFSFGSGSSKFGITFGEVLGWTLIWAFFATFTNYFLGMFVAMLINKKGIKLKKMWRTILVFTIAIPQFISLLYVSKMFADNGIVNHLLMNLGIVSKPVPFWTDPTWAKVTVILINIWVGIPYLMLITTGILMNIPADLYESSKIDGANAWKQYTKITLPYMLFVTGPYLLTSFTSNMNNFNVIFLLSGGEPSTNAFYGSAGQTDLLITWLYKLTLNDNDYKLAAVIGIMVFLVVAFITLVVYNIIPSNKNEEDFA